MLLWSLAFLISIPNASAAARPVFISEQHLVLRTTCHDVPRGGGLIPGGYNPFGYKITKLGEQFLEYEGSLESDVGRLLSTLKSQRKTFKVLKDQWLEVLRVSKSGQSMRIYRLLQELLDFCVKAGLVD